MASAIEQNGYLKEITFTARVQRLCCCCTRKSNELIPLQQIGSQENGNEAIKKRHANEAAQRSIYSSVR